MRGETGDLVMLRQLCDRMALALDRQDTDAILDLFTDDGEFTSETVGVLRGREELRAIGARFDPAVETQHFIGNHVCQVEGDTASAVVYCLARRRAGDGADATVTITVVRYEDTYRRTDGRWLISSRITHRRWGESAVGS